MIYLDHAAATPVDPDILAAMQPYFSVQFYNPSATYLAAKDVHNALDAARSAVAQVIGARPGEIVFTAGGTEANNLALLGVARQFPNAHIVTTAMEHESVLKPLAHLQQQGWAIDEVKPRADGLVAAESVVNAITDRTVLVSMMLANNEVGTIQPVKQIAQELQYIRKKRVKVGNDLPLYFHTDACQAVNYLDIHVHRLGVDMMTLNGGKIYGPKQSGALYVSSSVQLQPLIWGGGQELNRRSGTENVAASIGFATALERAQSHRHDESKRLQDLQRLCISLLEKKLPTVHINGSLKHRLPNNIHVTIPSADNERLIFALDDAGIQAAAGSACSASNEESSHVLRAMGLSDEEARASLRFTMGRSTTDADIHTLVETLAKIVG